MAYAEDIQARDFPAAERRLSSRVLRAKNDFHAAVDFCKRPPTVQVYQATRCLQASSGCLLNAGRARAKDTVPPDCLMGDLAVGQGHKPCLVKCSSCHILVHA